MIPYGRGAVAIAREVKREGIEVSTDETKRWIQVFNETHWKVAKFLQACKNAVIDPGFVVNPFGRVRAFPRCEDEDLVHGMQREAANYSIQSTVGDAMSRALINFWAFKEEFKCRDLYRILLSIHDAVMLEVPIKNIERVIEEVLPMCMVDGVEVPGYGLHYTIGDPEIMLRWGEHAPKDELIKLGVPEKYCE